MRICLESKEVKLALCSGNKSAKADHAEQTHCKKPANRAAHHPVLVAWTFPGFHDARLCRSWDVHLTATCTYRSPELVPLIPGFPSPRNWSRSPFFSPPGKHQA